MVSFKITVLVAVLIIVFPSDAWRRRRRRRCPVQDCQVSSWSSWSSCSAWQCGQQGSQSRSRWRVTSPSCGGAECPDTYETRNCYASTPVDCQLSSWSEWSACTTPCGASGTQHSTRHRLETEECGGTCTSTFRKTRSCQELSCLNGGSSKDGKCLCKEGYYGNCCERGEGKEKMNCQLSSWSEWGSCSTPCGVSGSQTSSRHRTVMEQYGGTCASTLQKTRACLKQLSCLNGGTLQYGTCSCKKGYSGHCCEVDPSKHWFWKIFPPCMAVVFVIIVYIIYRKCKNNSVYASG